MKRRAISLLAILAMLCTMAVFAMPATVAAEVTYPRYKDHETAMANGHDGKNWSISSKEDWEAMREVANAATEDYFSGVTFHLTNDIDFVSDEKMEPMGLNTINPRPNAAFAGTIDGHGYGFNNVYIYTASTSISGDKTTGENQKDIIHTGLFLRLGNCTFRDFGLNSGLIYQASSNAAGVTSSFGTVMPGKTPSFERVWSSAYISPYCNARANGLAGTISNTPITVNVNGFVFDGILAKRKDTSNSFSYAVLHAGNNNSNPGTFYNIIADCEAYTGRVTVSGSTYNFSREANNTVPSALVDFSTVGVLDTVSIGNIYGVKRKTNGIQGGFSIAAVLNSESKSAALMTDMSAAEAAYTINQKNQNGEIPEGVEPVYFTLNSEGKVRPIPEGKSDGKIVKISVTGDVTKNVFVAPNTTVNLKEKLGYKIDLTFVNGAGGSTTNVVTVGTDDVTVQMSNPCVEHEMDYVFNAETKQHSGTCSNCGHQILEDCELIDCQANPIDWNAATHNGTCKKCNGQFTDVCAYEYTKTDDGYKYICVCDRPAEAAAAPMVAGDAKGDGKVDLTDAIALLKMLVKSNATINERNADVDGNGGAPDIVDVKKIILFFLKDKKTVDAFEAIEQRVNEANFYNEETTESGNLKMDGTEGTNERYVRTEYISVSEGNKIVFGPVRRAQAVMGHFYDKDGKPIEVINVNNENLTTEHPFKAEVQGRAVTDIEYGEYGINSAVIGDLLPKEGNGLEMVSISVPEGAAYVRLQANVKEADKFYIRINNEFSLADYQCRTKGDTNTLKNEEDGQWFLTVGDSLCSASRDDQDDTVLPGRGWEGRIHRDLGAATVDTSQGGSTISTKKYLVSGNADLDTEGTSTSFDPRKCILNQLTMHRESGTAFEYILLEGGGNDAAYDADVGYIADSYDPKDFAPEETFIGNLERLIYSAIKTYGDTVALGFLVAYPMPKDDRFVDMGNYFQYVDEVCEKWDIPYLDFFYDKEKNIDTDVYTTNDTHTKPDNIHVGGAGYDIMQKYITPFVENEMRPANQEIYLEIQKYNEIPQNLGKK